MTRPRRVKLQPTYPPRTCARAACGRTFRPWAASVYHCSEGCAILGSYAREGRQAPPLILSALQAAGALPAPPEVRAARRERAIAVLRRVNQRKNLTA